MEMKKKSLTGNEAAAWAVRIARAKAAFSFPMGPNAEVTETLQGFIDQKEIEDLRVVYGDNEKATTSMQIGMARMGLRSMLCINSEGILWAAAEIHYAAGSRLPLLLVCPSRALEPPTTIYCDHDDFMVQRDMGWLMFYCENAQDIFDTILQVYKIIEQESVMLPAIVGYDGWETSHASSVVNLPDQPTVDRFLPPPAFVKPEKDYLNVNWKQRFSKRRRQHGVGGRDFMDLKYLQMKAEEESAQVIEAVGREYREIFQSPYTGLLEAHECEDAEIILFTMGTIYPSTRFVVDALRGKGIKIGCMKIRVFRPFPGKILRETVKKAKLVITIERNSMAALFHELRGTLYPNEWNGASARHPVVMGKVIGIGGAAISVQHIAHIVEDGLQALKLGRIERELEWFPIKGIQFNPTRDIIAE